MTEPEAIGSSTLCDALDGRGAITALVAQTPGRHVQGTAHTVTLTPGDNLALHLALAEAEPGEILVAFGAGAAEHGIFGEILARAALERGVVALVTDGRIRDRARIADMGLAVWAAGTSPRKAAKAVADERRAPVALGDITVEHGDHVIADDDGVVVAPRADRDGALERARAILEHEATILAGLRAGASTLDLLHLHPTTTTEGTR
jgi:4-hydroxy-4-methyl-2-oxoglutarate aldolase